MYQYEKKRIISLKQLGRSLFGLEAGLVLAWLVTVVPVHAQQTEIANGIAYLQATQSSSGSWGGTLSSTNDVIPTTTSVVETFRFVESGPSSQQLLGRSFLLSQQLVEPDYIARRILALAVREKGTGYFSWIFLGRPRGVRLDTSPSSFAIIVCQSGEPKGAWRLTEVRMWESS